MPTSKIPSQDSLMAAALRRGLVDLVSRALPFPDNAFKSATTRLLMRPLPCSPYAFHLETVTYSACSKSCTDSV